MTVNSLSSETSEPQRPVAPAEAVGAATGSAPGSSLSLRSLGDGTFEVTSNKRGRDGSLEQAIYLVYAQSLRCSCPSGRRGGDRTGLCKHARVVDAYLAGSGPDYSETI